MFHESGSIFNIIYRLDESYPFFILVFQKETRRSHPFINIFNAKTIHFKELKIIFNQYYLLIIVQFLERIHDDKTMSITNLSRK